MVSASNSGVGWQHWNVAICCWAWLLLRLVWSEVTQLRTCCQLCSRCSPPLDRLFPHALDSNTLGIRQARGWSRPLENAFEFCQVFVWYCIWLGLFGRHTERSERTCPGHPGERTSRAVIPFGFADCCMCLLFTRTTVYLWRESQKQRNVRRSLPRF